MSNKALYSAALILAKTGIDAATSYTTVGTLPTTNRIETIIFTNNSIADIIISMDAGTTDHFFIPGGSTLGINYKELDLHFDPTVAIHYKNINSTTTNTNDRLVVQFIRS